MQIDYKYDQTHGLTGTILAEDIKQIRNERNRILIAMGANPDDVETLDINDLLYRIEMGIAKSVDIVTTADSTVVLNLTSHKNESLVVGDSISFITSETIPDINTIFIDGQFVYQYQNSLKPLNYYELLLTDTGYIERTFSTTSDAGLAYNMRRRENDRRKAYVDETIEKNDMSKDEKNTLIDLANDLQELRNDFKEVQDFIDGRNDIPYISDILSFRAGIVEGLLKVTEPMLKDVEDTLTDYRKIIEEYRIVIDEIGLSIQTGIDACIAIDAKTVELDNYVNTKRIVQTEDLTLHIAKAVDSVSESTTFLESYNHMIVPNIIGKYPSKGELITDLDTFYSTAWVDFMTRYDTFNFRLTRFEAQYVEDKLLLLPHIDKNNSIVDLVKVGNYEDTIVEPLVSSTDAFLDKLENLKLGIEHDSIILRQLSITDSTIANVYARFNSASSTLNALLSAVSYLVDNISDHPEFRDTIDLMWEDAKFINANYLHEYEVIDYTVEEMATITPALTFVQSDYKTPALNLYRGDGLDQTIQDIIDARYEIVKDWTSSLRELFDGLNTRKESMNITVIKQMLPTQMHKDIKFPVEYINMEYTAWTSISKIGNKLLKFYDGAMIYNNTSNTLYLYSSIFHDIEFTSVTIDSDFSPMNGDFANFRNTLVYVYSDGEELVIEGLEYTLGTFRRDASPKRINLGRTLGTVIEVLSRGNGLFVRMREDLYEIVYEVIVGKDGKLTGNEIGLNLNLADRITSRDGLNSFETTVTYVDGKMVKQFNPLSTNSNQIPLFRHQDFQGGEFINGQGISIMYLDGKTYMLNVNCF